MWKSIRIAKHNFLCILYSKLLEKNFHWKHKRLDLRYCPAYRMLWQFVTVNAKWWHVDSLPFCICTGWELEDILCIKGKHYHLIGLQGLWSICRLKKNKNTHYTFGFYFIRRLHFTWVNIQKSSLWTSMGKEVTLADYLFFKWFSCFQSSVFTNSKSNTSLNWCNYHFIPEQKKKHEEWHPTNSLNHLLPRCCDDI